MMTGDIRIDVGFAQRLFDELGQRTADAPGVTRAAFGPGEQIAHEAMRREARALQLAEATDAAGNLYLTLAGRDPALPEWIVGSHLDSVPHGGNFDGSAGVIAGLAAVKALIDAGVTLRRSVTVMAIRAEESNWFPISYLGSKAAFGLLSKECLLLTRSDTGRSLFDHMADVGLRPERVAQGEGHLVPKRIHGFVEIHIEQGPVLEAEETPIGLVTGIAGSFRYRKARCIGEWGHSGAVPRAHRHDAVFAVAELINKLDEAWARLESEGHGATVTFGEIGTDAKLHGFSTVPGAVAFSLDVRSQSTEILESIHSSLIAAVSAIEAGRGVRFLLGDRTGSVPAMLDAGLRQSLGMAARARSVGHLEILSGAGHDAAVFANLGVPAAMLFVRNQNGSHNPAEAMRIEDFASAAEVLASRLVQED